MNPIQVVMRGAADWNPLRRGVTSLLRGMFLFMLGILLVTYAYYDWSSHFSLHGQPPPGSVVMVYLTGLSGITALVVGPLMMLVGVFMLTSIPAASGVGRWAAWGVVSCPVFLGAFMLTWWGIRHVPGSQDRGGNDPVQAALPPDASLWDSVVGPSNGQKNSLPAPAPVVEVTPDTDGYNMSEKVIGGGVFLLAVGTLFFWTLCINHILRAAAQSWGDRVLRRRFPTFFTVAWCSTAIWGIFLGKWGFFDREPAMLQRITDACLPELTGDEILYSAPVVLLLLMSWHLVLLRRLLRRIPTRDGAR